MKIMLFGKIFKIRDALLTVMRNVGHYEALNVEDKYTVWAEDAEAAAVHANNEKKDQAIRGTVDYFTKEDADENVDKIQEALRKAEGVTFALNSVQTEEETGYIHFEWLWEVS